MFDRTHLNNQEAELSTHLEQILKSRDGFYKAVKALGSSKQLQEEIGAVEYAHTRVVDALACVRDKLRELNHHDLSKHAVLRKVLVILDTLHTDGGYHTDFHHDFITHRYYGVYSTKGDVVRVVPLQTGSFELKHLIFAHLQVSQFSVNNAIRVHSSLDNVLGEYARRLSWYNGSHQAAFDNVQFLAVVDTHRLDFIELMHGPTTAPQVAPDLP